MFKSVRAHVMLSIYYTAYMSYVVYIIQSICYTAYMLYRIHVLQSICSTEYMYLMCSVHIYSKLKGVLPLAACSDGITAAKNCPKYTCTYNKQVRLGKV